MCKSSGCGKKHKRSIVALCMDGEEYIAVVTGCTGGIISLGMKLLDGE